MSEAGDRPGFQPLWVLGNRTWGVAPGWDGVRRWREWLHSG